MTGQRGRIFITGATGYIGARVVELAVREGYVVHGLSRSASGAAKLTSLGAVPVTGNLSSLDVLRSEAAESDVVIHLADPWIDDFTQPYDNVIAVDGAAVDALVQGLAQSKGRKLLLDTSGIAVVEPDARGGETDESSPENPNPLNGRIHREKYNLGKAGDGGVRVCVMRLPPFVYGRGGSGVKLFMDVFAKLGFAVRIGDGAIRTSFVHVDDAARAYILAANHACVGEEDVRNIYNVSSSTEITLREFTAAIADTMGLPVREMSAVEVAEVAGPFIVALAAHQVRGNSDKIRKELGWMPIEVDIIQDIRDGSYVSH